MRRGLPRDERGVTLVLMALFMTLILGMAALTIDYGMVKSEKAEAQRAGDAAALAGASSLIVANGRDASASWDDATNTVAGSTAGANWLTNSPRVIIVGLFNPSQYGGCPSCNTVQL